MKGLLLLALLLPATLAAQDSVEGYWEGALVRDGAVRLVRMEIFRDGNALKARTRFPDLPNSERILAVTQNGASVKVELNGTASLTYDATTGEMIGVAGVGTPPVRLHLKRALAPVGIPIRSQEVRISTLAATLVTPANAGPHPAVIFIHGRGKSTRAGYRGFARILAERGVASLIYDKRGAGESGGDHDAASLHDHADDVLAAIDFLATRREIDSKQIGLRGNSAGGWVTAIVASRSKVPLAFIITTVGPAESVMDQQIHVATAHMKQSNIGFTPEEYAAAAAHMALVTRFAYNGTGWYALLDSVARAKASRWAGFVDLPENDQNDEIAWVRRNQYDPAPHLKKIATPFLALYGGSDYVVPPEENVPKLERCLKEAGNKDFTIVVIPGVGHELSFSDEVRKLPGEPNDNYYWLWPKYAPEALRVQVEWLLAHVTHAGGDGADRNKHAPAAAE